jgi:hypothetical protein
MDPCGSGYGEKSLIRLGRLFDDTVTVKQVCHAGTP